MTFRSANILFAGILGAAAVLLICAAARNPASGNEDASSANKAATIVIDYPQQGSIFPPEITPPNFLWHDPAETATQWVVEVSFAGIPDRISVQAPGDHLRMGKLDPQAGPGIELTPEQAATRTWRPDAATWAKIKTLSAKSPTTIVISGLAGGDSNTLGY